MKFIPIYENELENPDEHWSYRGHHRHMKAMVVNGTQNVIVLISIFKFECIILLIMVVQRVSLHNIFNKMNTYEILKSKYLHQTNRLPSPP